jgi:NTE family protein
MNDFHRALIFQGGGSLGAYEAGAYKAAFELLSERDEKLGRQDKPMFHIVAGTSIGAMNAAVLVSYVKENKTWQGSADRLIEFWEYLSTEAFVDKLPHISHWWDYWHRVNNNVATGESARRYYSTKEFILKGVPNVFRPSTPLGDKRFFDPMNTWYLYSNKPLRKSLERFAKFPIGTSFENNEPRLLLVSIDVQEGVSVVFDSYMKEDGSRKTEYGNYGPEFARSSNEQEGYEHVIKYNDGIPSDFVLASGSVPVNYDYTKLVEDYSSVAKNNNNNVNDNSNNTTNNDVTSDKKVRYFWDGGLLSNTPLRETVIEHRRYWHFIRKCEVPPLRVTIINLHPIRQDYLPTDYDGVVDRKNDLTYHDKTLFDERMAILMSDYVNLGKTLIKLAQDNGVGKDLINNILQQQALTRHFSTGKQFTYGNLLEGGVPLDFTLRLQRKNDIHTVANKTFDFSYNTIRQLIKDGYEEAREQGIKALQDTEKKS